MRTPRLDHALAQVGTRPFLGTLLVNRGLLTRERLDAALEEVQRSGRRLGEVLIARGWLFEGELAHALAQQNDLPYIDIAARSVDPAAAALLPRDFAEHFTAVPIRILASGAVLVAVADPSDVDVETLRVVFNRDVELGVSELSAIKNAWRHCA